MSANVGIGLALSIIAVVLVYAVFIKPDLKNRKKNAKV